MDQFYSPGSRLLAAIEAEQPLQMVGVINAYSALLAEKCGFRAIYLSGAGVANASFGLPDPDLGVTSLNDVCEEVRRITAATDLPLLVDADVGWGAVFNNSRATTELTRVGAAGMHLKDQVQAKRCGHRRDKALVAASQMVDRIQAAVSGLIDPSFVIMARTDAHAIEGPSAAIERAQHYVEAGANMIFAEGLTTLEEYRQFTTAVRVPVLANITEFGKTPLFRVAELGEAGVAMVVYPLSGFRAMNKAAAAVFESIRRDGTQKHVIYRMQTRTELDEVLGHHEYEGTLDELLGGRRRKIAGVSTI